MELVLSEETIRRLEMENEGTIGNWENEGNPKMSDKTDIAKVTKMEVVK